MLIEIITWPATLSARLLLAIGIWLFEKPLPDDTGNMQPGITGKLSGGYLTDAALTIGGEVQATPLVQRRG